MIQHSALVGLLVHLCLFGNGIVHATRDGVFTDCSVVLDQPRGIIQTPNFPGPFPSPISCSWLIKAPPNKKIILYFTQFYVHMSFHVAEFDFYQNDRNYSGLNELGEISYVDILSSLVAYKPYVVISFMTPADTSNTHLRVEEYLLDVHGFNITYEVVDREESVRKHTCSVHDCSFLGHCLATHDFSNYSCNCFSGYFGEECQYGPYCDPEKNINMCKNGGLCRYLYGSLVNTCECPPDYEGPQCQIRKDHVSPECLALNCKQKCVKGLDDVYRCGCHDGYRLDNNNVSCVEEGRLRVVVGILIRMTNTTPTAVPGDVFHGDEFLRSLKNKVSEACDHWGPGVCDISPLGISSFRNTSGGHILEFYFYCEKSDIQNVENAMRVMVSRGSIPPFTINEQYLEIQTDPTLQLVDVQNYDRRPAIQGKLLTLVCTARGSQFLKFRWFKDGALIQTSQTKRNAWEQRVPATVHETQLDILNIENVTPLDKGVFTCEVKDYNEAENKSLSVDVIVPPSVQMNTLSVSVMHGQPLSLNCLSPEDTRGSFEYSWLRDGKPLKTADNAEIVEDLLPTGVRLTLKSTIVQANYSCIVGNKAGNSSLTIPVYVIHRNDSGLICSNEWLADTQWDATAPDGLDRKSCPKGSRGYMHRQCRCTLDERQRACSWSDINFAGCQSEEFLAIANQIQLVTLGYQQTTLLALFDVLKSFVNTSQKLVTKGDVPGALDTLYELLDHYYLFIAKAQGEKIPLKEVVQLLGALVSLSQTFTSDELETSHIQPSFFRIINLITEQSNASLGIKAGDVLVGDWISFSMIAPLPRPVTDTIQKSMDSPNKHIVLVDRRFTESQFAGKEFFYSIQLREGLFNIPTAIAGEKKFRIVSDFWLMIPTDLQLKTRVSHSSENGITIVVHHNEPINLSQRNTSAACLQWEVSQKYPYRGTWAVNNCMLISVEVWETVCLCPHSAMVAVAMGEKAPIVSELQTGPSKVLLFQLACVLCLCALITSLLIHLILYRCLKGDIYSVTVNLLIALISANGVLLVCVNNQQNKVLCIAGRLLLYFFFLSAFSFLLMDGVYMYLVLNRNITRLGHAFRYFILGWGVPSVLIVIIVAVCVADYRDWVDSGEHICWLSYSPAEGIQQFSTVIAPASVLILGYIILTAFTVRALIRWKEEGTTEKHQHIFHVIQSSTIVVLLLITCILKAYIDEDVPGPILYIYIFFNTLLGFCTLVFRCFFDAQIRRRILCSKEDRKDVTAIQSSVPLVGVNAAACAGFSRPVSFPRGDSRDGMSGSSSRGGQSVASGTGSQGACGSGQMLLGRASFEASDYSRRKERLLTLLGTNTMYNGIHLGDIPDNAAGNNGGLNHRDNYLDSGIFEGSDPEKSSTPSNSSRDKESVLQCDRSLGRPSPRSGQDRTCFHENNRHRRNSFHASSKASNNSGSCNDSQESNSQDIQTNLLSDEDTARVNLTLNYPYTYSTVVFPEPRQLPEEDALPAEEESNLLGNDSEG